MLEVISCVVTEHDLRLVGLAALICVATCVAALFVFDRGRSDLGLSLVRMAFAGAFTGVGVWATHFIAMLAYQPALPTGYEPVKTGASLVVAIGVSTGAFMLARRQGPLIRACAGAVLGLGVAAMHFIGISAFETAGRLSWNAASVVVAIVLAAGFGAAAFYVFGRLSGWRSIAAGAVLLVLSICGLHFTAMDAITITPDPTLMVHGVVDRPVIGLAIAGVIGFLMLAAMVGHRIESLHSERAASRLRDAIGAMSEGLAFFDREDRLQVWNSRYADVLAQASVTLRAGMPLPEIVVGVAAANGRHMTAEKAAELLKTRRTDPNRPPSSEIEFGPGGGWLRIQEKQTPDGGFISTLVDITELKRQAQSLITALDQAQAANRAKTAFLANMSHEIRTPLNGVLGIAQVLAMTGLNPRQRELVDVIRNSATLLENVLTDVLDLARAESGEVRLVVEPMRVGDMLRATADLQRPAAEAKGLVLHLDDAAVADDLVSGDALRLRQVLGNFLANAVKFTATGFVRLEADRLTDGRYRFMVVDSGPGVDPARVDALFQRFSQVDDSITRQFGGSGLGLAICREYATLMGGEVSYAPTPAGGSRFTLIVPLAQIAAPDLADEPDEAGMRALIVDDNAVNRQVLGLILDQVGAEHVQAQNGAEAVDAYRREPFDVVLMDIQMPVMDGIAATSAIRALEAEQGRARTPVIIVSANCQDEHHAAGRAAGADAHLAKPVSVPGLLGALAGVGSLEADGEEDAATAA